MTRWHNRLYGLSVIIGAVGWWLPWVNHRNGAAALVLVGQDLGEFWRFSNEWQQQGLFEAERLFFFLPPAIAALLLALWLGRQQGWWRLLWLPVLLFLSTAFLPPIDELRAVLLPDNPLLIENPGDARAFAFPWTLCLIGLGVTLLTPLWKRLPLRLYRVLTTLFALIGALLPAYALWYTWNVLQGLYGDGAVPGPGVFVTTISFLVSAITVWNPSHPPKL